MLAVVEATQGTRHKYKHDPDLGTFVLDGVLPLGLSYPCDFGFIPSTIAADGDPLDILVIGDESVPAGMVVRCRLLGVIEATQRDRGSRRAVRNDRLVAMVECSRRYAGCKTLNDLPTELLEDMERFFVIRNRLNGGEFKPIGRGNVKAATRLLDAALHGGRGREA